MTEYAKRKSDYAKAVAEADRQTRFYVAKDLKYTVPSYLVDLENRISELQLAWRDMGDDEKAALKAETMRKCKNFVRQRISRDHADPGNVSNVGPERDRQLDALYRAMTPEDQALCV